jgi:hypothetical protein
MSKRSSNFLRFLDEKHGNGRRKEAQKAQGSNSFKPEFALELEGQPRPVA